MKKNRPWRGFGLLLVWLAGILPVQAQSYENLWKQVEQASAKGLPQTVIKLTDEICRKAGREKNVPQMLKASLCRDNVRERLTPDSFYVHLEAWEAWARTEENPVNRAILHSLLSRRYADYLRAHASTVRALTPLAPEDAPADIREWSANLFIDAVDRHSREALKQPASLLDTSSDTYLPLVEQEAGSRFYGHDLYHLLARRAVDDYNGLLLGYGADTLLGQRIREVYEGMIRLYRERPDGEDALILSTIDYWEWRLQKESRLEQRVNNVYATVRLNEEYPEQLDRLIADFGHREVCAEAYIKKARWLGDNQGKTAAAVKVCDEGLRRYPAYKRINTLKDIRAELLRPFLHVRASASGGYPGDSLALDVTHKNGGGDFTLRLYATNLAEYPLSDSDRLLRDYKKYITRPVFSHRYQLSPRQAGTGAEDDRFYQENDTLLRLPLPSEVGTYILQAVPAKAAVPRENLYLVSVSCLKVLLLNVSDDELEVFTADARSGQPEPGVTVNFYPDVARDRKGRQPSFTVTTGSDGKTIVSRDKVTHSYTARKGKDTAMPLQDFYWRGRGSRNGQAGTGTEELVLLTDRSLYRPGQTVYVKGIAYRAQEREAEALTDTAYELVLLDTNGKELSAQTARTNDFGSFSLEFTLPAACLNGAFTISTRERRHTAVIRVEEYKRPTFEIDFTPVAHAYALGDRVMLEGVVTAYNGMALQGLPLAYTVSYDGAFRSYFGHQQPQKADSVRLDAQGHFAIPVDLLLPAGGEQRMPVGCFKVSASVTSEAGETQEADYRLAVDRHAFRLFEEHSNPFCREDSAAFVVRAVNSQEMPLRLDGTYRLLSLPDSVCCREGRFVTGVPFSLPDFSGLVSGEYCLHLVARDTLGREETLDKSLLLYSKHDTRMAVHTPLMLVEEEKTFDVGHPASFLLATSFKDAFVQMELFAGNKRIESRAWQLNDTLMRLEVPYREEYGSRASALFRLVKDGQLHEQTIELERPLPARTLDLKWEVFRDRLQPGQQEEWKLVVKTPAGNAAAAELLAVMYDASLDKIYRRTQVLSVLYPRSYNHIQQANSFYRSLYYAPYFTVKDWPLVNWNFDRICEYPSVFTGTGYTRFYGMRSKNAATAVVNVMSVRDDALVLHGAMETSAAAKVESMFDMAGEEDGGQENLAPAEATEEELSPVAESLSPATLRTNFAETAFFYPQLRTNGEGEVTIAFTMPQSLTRWNFHGYAHTRDMQVGELKATAVTSKEFMLTPNLPRFLCTGDRTQVAASIANLSESPVKGTVQLTLFDPQTEKVVLTRKEKFTAEAGNSTAVAFLFDVPAHEGLLAVRLVADGGGFSDGEQHLLPVLSNKQYVTETLPLPIRGCQTRTFSLDTLFNRQSATATDRRLTVEFTGNPAWYAVQALPVLAQPASDNAMEWGAALYANALAGYIADSQPRIRTVVEAWRQAGGTSETFLSKLQQNEELKEILLDESPWLMEARTETEQQARIATLFDLNRQRDRYRSALVKLKALQNPSDGSWSWFKGMNGSRSVTTYVASLLVRLARLTGQPLDEEASAMKRQAFSFLHREARAEYEACLRMERKGGKVTVPSAFATEYLYLVALDGTQVPQESRAAHTYFLSKVNGLLSGNDLVRKSQAVMILHQAGRKADASAFAASLREHLVQEDELGAHFAFLDTPYAWGMLPVSTHVAAMEALGTTGNDDALLEEMKLWLLKQKQTLSWNSSVSSADAIYALLCKGKDWLENRGDARITLGKQTLQTLEDDGHATLPGLAYVKKSYTEGNPALKARTLTVEKRDEGIAWGAVYAQFLSPVSDLEQQGKELTVKKQLYVERVDAGGRKSLQPLTSSEGAPLAVTLHVGDRIVTRLVITLDRAMDFLQLKDRRSACLEPVASLSGYRWSNGMGYYYEPGDVSANFFFDHLGKGTYVLEHTSLIARTGRYESGLATMQSAYAPEFAAHSAGGALVVE